MIELADRSLFGDEIEELWEFDPLTGEKTQTLEKITVFANSHYVTPRPTLQQAVKQIGAELTTRLAEFNEGGKLLEAQRLQQRTQFDPEMIEATGSCNGLKIIRAICQDAGRRATTDPV